MFESHAKADKPVTVPKYRYSSGNPVLINRSLWPRVMSLEGDDGAKRLWLAHPDCVNEVWISDAHPRGVDTEIAVSDLKPRHPA